MVGGSGVHGYTDEAYIADVIKEWSNTSERLRMALSCFQSLLGMLAGTGRAAGNARERYHQARCGGRYAWMAEQSARAAREGWLGEKITETANG